MKVLLLFACLIAGCIAMKPRPCKAPPRMTGRFSLSTANEKLTVYAKYAYDALGKRLRLREIGSYNNKTFHVDVLLLYKERVMYIINNKNHTCTKKPLNATFHPIEIPKTASLLGQVVLGSSSGPRQGLLVNTWVGELQMKNTTAKYMSTVTEFGCIPVSTLFHTNKTGWAVSSFFDNIIGIRDPEQLHPPHFCNTTQLEKNDGEDPATFFSLFENAEFSS